MRNLFGEVKALIYPLAKMETKEKKMNIYEFFNSKDIAEHCSKIGHQFTPIEMAYIIWFSEYHSLREKHEAWQYLIDNYPDEQLPKGKWCNEDRSPVRSERSLHKFLEHYIRIENDFIEQFRRTRAGYIYDYGMMHGGDDDYSEDDVFYDNYEACFAALADDFDENIAAARITRRRLYSQPRESGWDEDTIYINKNNEVIQIKSYALDDDWAIKDGFSDMYFHIPTPFQCGDLVVCNSVNGEKHPHFVLAYVPGWEKNERGRDMTWYTKQLEESGGDWTDMQTSIYKVGDNGDIYWAHGPNYLFLEYYTQELKEQEKILRPLSNFIKNEIGLEDFLTAYNIIRSEKYSKALRVYYADIDELKYKCGLLEGFNKKSK